MPFQLVHVEQYKTMIMPAVVFQDIGHVHNPLDLRVFHASPAVPHPLSDVFKNKVCNRKKKMQQRHIYRRLGL